MKANTPPSIPRPRRSIDGTAGAELVVVGVDGSEASVGALVWALRYAADHGAQVEVITAWPVHAPVFVREVPGHFNEARWNAVQAQARAIAQARSLVRTQSAPTARIENAEPLSALVAASEPAALLVLGTDRPHGAGAGTWTSLTVRANHAAACPVILVPLPAVEQDPAQPADRQASDRTRRSDISPERSRRLALQESSWNDDARA